MKIITVSVMSYWKPNSVELKQERCYWHVKGNQYELRWLSTDILRNFIRLCYSKISYRFYSKLKLMLLRSEIFHKSLTTLKWSVRTFQGWQRCHNTTTNASFASFEVSTAWRADTVVAHVWWQTDVGNPSEAFQIGSQTNDKRPEHKADFGNRCSHFWACDKFCCSS